MLHESNMLESEIHDYVKKIIIIFCRCGKVRVTYTNKAGKYWKITKRSFKNQPELYLGT